MSSLFTGTMAVLEGRTLNGRDPNITPVLSNACKDKTRLSAPNRMMRLPNTGDIEEMCAIPTDLLRPIGLHKLDECKARR